MHTFCTLSTDFVKTNSLLSKPFAESVHTYCRAYVFHSIAVAEPAGARWSCYQGQKGRGGGATAAAVAAYFAGFALGEAVAAVAVGAALLGEAQAAAGAAFLGEALVSHSSVVGEGRHVLVVHGGSGVGVVGSVVGALSESHEGLESGQKVLGETVHRDDSPVMKRGGASPSRLEITQRFEHS
jgi:hypothetical protein